MPPKKSESRPPRPATLSAVEVAKQSGVPLKSVRELTEQYPAEIPHEVEGDRIYYSPDAITALQKLRQELRAGQRERVSVTEPEAHRVALESIGSVLDQVEEFQKRLKNARETLSQYGPGATALIHSLPDGYRLRHPLNAFIEPSGKTYVASLPEAHLEATGPSREESALELRRLIVSTLGRLSAEENLSKEEAEQLESLLAVVIMP